MQQICRLNAAAAGRGSGRRLRGEEIVWTSGLIVWDISFDEKKYPHDKDQIEVYTQMPTHNYPEESTQSTLGRLIHFCVNTWQVNAGNQ